MAIGCLTVLAGWVNAIPTRKDTAATATSWVERRLRDDWGCHFDPVDRESLTPLCLGWMPWRRVMPVGLSVGMVSWKAACTSGGVGNRVARGECAAKGSFTGS
jgi:hypothetical protein